MWQYITIVALPIVCQHFIFVDKQRLLVTRENRSPFPMKLFWVLLLLLLLFRSTSVGIDLENYENIFDLIDKSSWSKALTRSPEIGWSFLNKLVAEIGGNFRWIIIISAVLSIWWVSKAFVRYSNDASLSIALFVSLSCFVFLFSGLRQSIAISIGFMAFEYTRKKKVLPFLITVLVAMLFHTSAFMLLFMYPLYHIRFKKYWLIGVVPLLILVYIFNTQIFTSIGVLLIQFTDYDVTITITGSVTTLILFIMLAVFAFLIPEESKMDADTVGLRNFLLFSVVLQMFAPLHHIAMRMNYYYIAFIPLLIPRIIQYRRERWKQVAVWARHIMIVVFLVYFFLTAPTDDLLHIFPYEFFWQK